MIIPSTLQVRVCATTYEAEGILGFELPPQPPATELPSSFTAGAHTDLHLVNGLVRGYSLLNAPQERHRYCIGVNKDAKSCCGSRYLHGNLRTDSILTIGASRNNFPLDGTARHNVFIVGGTGITPVLGMIARSRVSALDTLLPRSHPPERRLCGTTASLRKSGRRQNAGSNPRPP